LGDGKAEKPAIQDSAFQGRVVGCRNTWRKRFGGPSSKTKEENFRSQFIVRNFSLSEKFRETGRRVEKKTVASKKKIGSCKAMCSIRIVWNGVV